MWQRIFNKLRDKGLNPIPLGKHIGECKERYCVIKEQTQSAYFNARGLGYRPIDIIIFVPMASYLDVAPYVAEIKAAMRELRPDLRTTGTETPVITDDDRKAYTTSIVYQVMKRLEG